MLYFKCTDLIKLFPEAVPQNYQLFAPRSAQLCWWNQRGVPDDQARPEGKDPGWKEIGLTDSEGGQGDCQPDDRSRKEVRNAVVI